MDGVLIAIPLKDIPINPDMDWLQTTCMQPTALRIIYWAPLPSVITLESIKVKSYHIVDSFVSRLLSKSSFSFRLCLVVVMISWSNHVAFPDFYIYWLFCIIYFLILQSLMVSGKV